jgi:hypothetical protein
MAVIVRGQGRYELLHGCAQTTTDNYAVVTGSELDASAWRSVYYSIAVLTNSIKWQVWADNDPAFGTELVVQAEATVAANASGTFTIANAPYTNYRLKTKAAVGSSQGDVSVYGLMTG